MRIPLEVAFKSVEPTAAMERLVRERVERLTRYHRGIIACRVSVEAPHRSGDGDAVGHRVRVEVSVPGDELVVSRDRDFPEEEFDPYGAIRKSFEAMESQLKSYSGRQRRQRQPRTRPPHATVLRIFEDQGYGFLRAADGREIYFHENSVVNDNFDELEIGEEVRFEATEGRKGPQATTVKQIGRHGYRYLTGAGSGSPES